MNQNRMILRVLSNEKPNSHLLDVIEFKYLLRLKEPNRKFLLRILAHLIAVEAVKYNFRELKSLKYHLFQDVSFELKDYPVTDNEFNRGPLGHLDDNKEIKVSLSEPRTNIGTYITEMIVLPWLLVCICTLPLLILAQTV